MTGHAMVIAGGGPTGLMLAAELALAGVDVAIVERRASQDLTGSRAGGLHSRTIEVLDQRGIADRFLSQGHVAQVAQFSGIPLDISDFPTRHDYGLGLWQNHIERILAGWIGELAVPIYTPKRTGVILSMGTLALVLLAAVVVAATGRADEVVAWAWARHHNVLSWCIRPLFILPFCYFAYRRSLWGIVLTLLALATSMFWFPNPEHSSPAVNEMLASEREYLTANWTLWNVLIALLVPLGFAALALAFWRRSPGGWRS
jgi:flavin-dependent dehydrogenase